MVKSAQDVARDDAAAALNGPAMGVSFPKIPSGLERKLQRFKLPGSAQRFLATFNAFSINVICCAAAFQGASRRFIPHLGRGLRHRMTPVARYIQLNADHEFLNATVMPYSSAPHCASHVSLPDTMRRWQIFCINKETTMKTWFKPEITETEAGMEVTSYLPAELDRA